MLTVCVFCLHVYVSKLTCNHILKKQIYKNICFGEDKEKRSNYIQCGQNHLLNTISSGFNGTPKPEL